MPVRYDPKQFEAKWSEAWEQDGLYKTTPVDQRPKAYILDFFPYPSGDGLSVGHCRNYVPTDVLSRYYRMRGYNVLHPMGWDAFGLPAENAAIKQKTNPAKLIAQFSANYKRQFRLIGISFDWNREINSSSEEYYRWTQWIFLKLYNAWYDPRVNAARPIDELEFELAKSGSAKIPDAAPIGAEQWQSLSRRDQTDYLMNFRLAYRFASTVNWDPAEKTVLANEEVIDGRGWRSGALVEKKVLMQWFFRITAFAERLLSDLDVLDWPENIKLMQRNWIGRSEGAEVNFHTEAGDLKIFTTRPDTLWGATFMVLAPEHPLVVKLTSPEFLGDVQRYIVQSKAQSDLDRTSENKEKTGVFTGAYVVNPVNGERIPIWIADYVLMGYGTGAIMAVPAHDQRDFEFARRFSLPIRVVIRPEEMSSVDPDKLSQAWPGEGKMVNSGDFNGTPTEVAVGRVTTWLEAEGKGRRRVHYKLRDWGISRQRYWGTPIPIIHTDDGEVAVSEDSLPVRLPPVQYYEPTDTGESPLATIPEFVNTTLSDGSPGRRETDTMGTFACSSWYYLRFADPHNANEPFSRQRVDYWLPVDMYVGGAEHAVMHLLYARFWTKALHDLGYLSFVEPFKQLRNQGMILAPDGKEKMSKSKGNVITPDDVVAEWGADPLRAYEMFISDFEMATPWNTNGLSGTHRWLRRAWDIILNPVARPPVDNSTEEIDRDLRRWTHKTIKKVSEDIEGFRFNTVISTMMEFTNQLFEFQRKPVSDHSFVEATDALLLMLAPIAPFMAEELWHLKGRKYSIHQQGWAQFDSALAADEVITLVLQVNGKVRGRLTMPVGLSEEQARAVAMANESVIRHLGGRAPRKIIYVPGRLVNVVV